MANLSSFYPCQTIPLNRANVRLEKAGILRGQPGQCHQWVDTQAQQPQQWNWLELPMSKHLSTTHLTIHSTIPTTATPLLMARKEWVLVGADFLKTNSLVQLLKSFWTSSIQAHQQDTLRATFLMKLMEVSKRLTNLQWARQLAILTSTRSSSTNTRPSPPSHLQPWLSAWVGVGRAVCDWQDSSHRGKWSWPQICTTKNPSRQMFQSVPSSSCIRERSKARRSDLNLKEVGAPALNLRRQGQNYPIWLLPMSSC